jgi:hypothetical protein
LLRLRPNRRPKASKTKINRIFFEDHRSIHIPGNLLADQLVHAIMRLPLRQRHVCQQSLSEPLVALPKQLFDQRDHV